MPWADFFETYGLVLAAILFGAFVARATGVGFALLLVAAMLAIPYLDQPTVLFLIAPLSLLNLGIIAFFLHRATPWQEVRHLTVPAFMGIIAGIALGIGVGKVWILIFGLLVVAYNIWTMVKPTAASSTSAMANPWVGGGLTGIMTGTLCFPGPPISAYMLARSYIGDPVRMTVAVAGIAAMLIRLMVGWPFVTWRPEFWQLLSIGAALVIFGTLVGALAANRLSATTHRILIITLTLAAFTQLSWGLMKELALV